MLNFGFRMVLARLIGLLLVGLVGISAIVWARNSSAISGRWHEVPIAAISGFCVAWFALELWRGLGLKRPTRVPLRYGFAETVISLAALAIMIVGGINVAKSGAVESPHLGRWLLIGVGWTLTLSALFFAPGGVVQWLEHLRENPELRRWFLFGRGGSARWAGPRSLRAQRSGWKRGTGGISARDIYLGRSIFDDDFVPRHIGVEDDAHLLTVGQPGSGKSTTVLWPNLAAYQGTVIVVDPKGEHAKMTAGYRARKFGAPAFVLDPFERFAGTRTRYNPLAEIDIHGRFAQSMLQAVSDACIIKSGSGESVHFEDNARLLLEGIIAHTMSTAPRERHTLPAVFDLVQGLDENGFANPETFDAMLIDMLTNPAAGGVAQQAATMMRKAGEREQGSILSTLQRGIKWISDEVMREQLAGSDFRFADIADDGTSIYVVLPDQLMDSYSRWLRIVVNMVLMAYKLRPEERKPDPAALMILDEFPKMGGALRTIEDNFVTLRSSGLKLWPVIQNVGQLKRDYGENWRTFEGAATVQAIGVRDQDTAQWLCELLGEHRVARKEVRSGKKQVVHESAPALYTVDEVRKELAKNAGKQIVIPNDGSTPMRLERLAFKPLKVEGRPYRGLPLDELGIVLDEHTTTERRYDGHAPLNGQVSSGMYISYKHVAVVAMMLIAVISIAIFMLTQTPERNEQVAGSPPANAASASLSQGALPPAFQRTPDDDVQQTLPFIPSRWAIDGEEPLWVTTDACDKLFDSFSVVTRYAEDGWEEAMLTCGIAQVLACKVPKDYAAAVEWFQRAEKAGAVEASAWLGRMYAAGHGVPVNESVARQFYAKAYQADVRPDSYGIKYYVEKAEAGDAKAMRLIGKYVEAVGQNVAAYEWFRLAADRGDTDAMREVAYAYSRGKGVVQDKREAFRWHEKAAHLGDVSALYKTAVAYRNGWGVQVDEAQYIARMERCAEDAMWATQAMRDLQSFYQDRDEDRHQYWRARLRQREPGPGLPRPW